MGTSQDPSGRSTGPGGSVVDPEGQEHMGHLKGRVWKDDSGLRFSSRTGTDQLHVRYFLES